MYAVSVNRSRGLTVQGTRATNYIARKIFAIILLLLSIM